MTILGRRSIYLDLELQQNLYISIEKYPGI